ncbi:PepSY-associated TM helix domain-containing protein [Actibacterium sp. D379-3]
MSVRRIFFWAHLVAGVSAGLVILFLSVTGVLLTYERQIVGWFENASTVAHDAGAAPLRVGELAGIAQGIAKNAPATLVLQADTDAPVTLRTGRSNTTLLDPYSGDVLDSRAEGAKAFFEKVTALHRWFALSGDARETGAAITGAANLIFLFITLSGLVLWWPKRWKWRLVRMNLWFRRGLPNAKARDYNWHHVFGIWALIPLVVVIGTAVVFSYSWADRAVYAAFGEEVPARRGPPGGAPMANQAQGRPQAQVFDGQLQAVVDAAAAQVPGWTRIELPLPDPADTEVALRVDTGTGGQPTKQQTLTYALTDATLTGSSGFTDNTPATQARILIRFLHTGEALGLTGQTLAGLASLASVFLVYTGLALAWRRLIVPLWRRRKA